MNSAKVTSKSAVDNQLSFSLYRDMRRIRTFEERVAELFVRGSSAGSMLHVSIGEEAAAVGVGRAMEPGDSFTTHHRGHGIFLARGADPKRMMAEIAGKNEGYCHGKGGSMHIADMALGHLGANAIVGGGIAAVVGAGVALKSLKPGSVSVAFFGDGAAQQGILYESMNLAALWNLPVVFCIINNQWGMGTRIDKATKSTLFGDRAEAFGLVAAVADGADAHDVVGKAEDIIGKARKGQPGLLVVECFRFYGHARMDKSPYRTEEEEAAGRKRDPVALLRAGLVASNPSLQAQLDALDAEIAAEMDATIDFAEAGRKPPHESLFRDVYGPDQPRPEPLQARIDRILSEQA